MAELTERLQIRVSPDLLARLKKAAKEDGRKTACFARHALAQALKANQSRQKERAT